ncbi:MAG: HAD family phosphatase [Bacilli bacterium]|nr:HAD family phosphatase [Bacilli bacterium]
MQIIASDFDNTIYYEGRDELNKKNIESIRKFINEGNIFIIITGRNFTRLKKTIDENNIPYTYLVCEDGAKLFNSEDICIDSTYLDEEEIVKVKQVLEDLKAGYYLDDGYKETNYHPDCVKIVVRTSSLDEKEKILNEIYDKINVHIYASRNHVNIIHKTVNKEYALRRLFDREKLDYSKLHTVGDDLNDYEMLKAFDGVVIKEHNPILDELNKEEYSSISDYIEYLLEKNKLLQK